MVTQQALPHLDGVQAHGLHSLQPVLPVRWVYAVVVNAARWRPPSAEHDDDSKNKLDCSTVLMA